MGLGPFAKSAAMTTTSENEVIVYIVRCADDTLYTGWTTHIERRVQAHNSGQGAKYTRSRRPVQLVYTEPQPSRSVAQQREAAIKKMSRRQKLELINKVARLQSNRVAG